MTVRLIDQHILIDASPVGMAVYKHKNGAAGEPASLQLLQANQAFCQALGMNELGSDEHLKAVIGVQGGKKTDWLTLVTSCLKDNPSQTARFMVKETGRWCRMNLVLKEQNLLLVYLTDESENIKREKAVLQVHPDLMFVFDAQGNYREVYTLDNDRLLVPLHQLIGTNLKETFPEEIAKDAIKAFREAIHTNRLVKYHYTLHVTDNPEHFEARIVPLEDQQVLVVVRDVTEDVNIKQQLEFQAAILDQIEDHVTVSDTKGVIQYVNQTQCNAFGISKKDFVGKSVDFFQIGNADSDQVIAESVLQTIEKGYWEGEIINKDKNGNKITFFCRDRMMKADKDDNQYIISTLTNITERKKAEEALVAEMERAEAASGAKTRFLANMSHEIRTPMNGMMGFIQLLHMTNLDQEQQEYVEYIDTAARSLLHVISDVLDITKIESEKIELNRSQVNIRHLVMEAAGMFTVKAAEKALSINVHVDPRVPDYVLGDAPKLMQIMTNLISNAVKFTDKGEVEVEVLLHRETDKQTWLKVMVKDQGIGVEETFYEHIFDPFVQVDMTVSKRFGGTGLGLSIVKRLVEFMGGTVGVQNRDTGGSIFELLLPFDK